MESLDTTTSTTYVDVVESWGANPFTVADYIAREAAGDYLEILIQFYEQDGHGQYALRYDGVDYPLLDTTTAVDGLDQYEIATLHNFGWFRTADYFAPSGAVNTFTLRYKWDGVTGSMLDIGGPTRVWWRFRGPGTEIYTVGEVDVSPDYTIPLWLGGGNWTFYTSTTDPETFALSYVDDLVVCDCTLGEVILNLPSSLAIGPQKPYGKQYKIKKRDASVNVVTVVAQTGWAGGADYIDDASATYTLANAGESVIIQGDSNHHWWVVASHLH